MSSGQLLASKIVIEEEEPRVRPIAGVTTSDTGFVGVAERGPVGVAVLVQSPDEYDAVFGGYTADGDLRQSVDGFFQNGGGNAYCVRTAHYTDPNDPQTRTTATAFLGLLSAAGIAVGGSVLGALNGPFDLSPGDTLVVDTDAITPTTATFNAGPASRESGAGPFALTDGMALNVTLDGVAQSPVTFLSSEFANIGAATAAEVAAVLNAKLLNTHAAVTNATKVTVYTDHLGSGAGLNITGGTANAVLGFATGNQAGTGNVADINAVSVAEVKTVVEGAVTGVTVSNVGGKTKVARNTTGTGATVQVTGASTAAAKLGLDNAVHAGSAGSAVETLRFEGKYEGTYAEKFQPKILPATSGEAERFNVQFVRSGVIVETFPNVTMDQSDERYVETVVNGKVGSKFLRAVDMEVPGTAATLRPADGLKTNLAGGSDGLVGLTDTDFTGSSSSSGKTGMRALDSVPSLNILTVPGRATAAVQNAMITYCEIIRGGEVFAILDSPPECSAEDVVTYFETTAALLGMTEFAAAYWPRVSVLNPNKSVFGTDDTINVPPSGHIAGVYARTDALQGGVYKPPAGIERGILQGVLGFDHPDCLEEPKRDLVYPKRINPLTALRGSPRHIDGTRTLKGNGNFPSVSERRGVIFIEQSIKDGLQYARHSNNDEALRASATRDVEAFLTLQMNVGAFRSRDPKKAFFVDFGTGLNTEAVIFAGQLIGRVGVATQKPTDFVILRFSQDTRALEEELAA